MGVWFILAGMVVISALLLGRPLFRPKVDVAFRPDYDLAVYREQLKDVDLDRKRGVLSESDYKNACFEIERRILAAGSSKDLMSHGQPSSGFRTRVPLIILWVSVPILTGIIYYQLGSPLMADQPFAERLVVNDRQSTDSEFDDAIAGLSARLAQDPDDLEGWILLARTYAFMQQFSDAVSAYREAAVLAPDRVDVLLSLAQSIVFSRNGRVTPSARGEFDKVLQLEPKNKIALFFVGLEREQAGDLGKAYEIWSDLSVDASPEDIWLPELKVRLQELAQKLDRAGDNAAVVVEGEDPGKAEESQTNTPAPGPTKEQIEAAGQMTEGERGEMIRGMVERLATRLEANPNDIEGWKRLGNARRVLGQLSEAEDAFGRALDINPQDLISLEAQAQIALETAEGHSIPQVAETNYKKILELQGARVDALWYLGLAAYQDSRISEARSFWTTLLNLLPADSPDAREVQRRLEEIGN